MPNTAVTPYRPRDSCRENQQWFLTPFPLLWTQADSLSYTPSNSMPGYTVKLTLLFCAAIIATSCAARGGERQEHQIKRNDGTIVTCFEPPPEVIVKVSGAIDLDASVKEIGGIAKATVRGEATPERIREKLPTDTAVYEVVHFRLCLDYVNGLLTPAEYQAINSAKGLSSEEKSKRTTERASLSLKDAAMISGPVEAGKLLVVRINYQNNGRSPALKGKIRHRIDIFKMKNLPDIDMPKISVENSMVVMGPNAIGSSELALNRLLTEEEVAYLQRKEWVVTTYGAITYNDIFGLTHETTFCLIWKDVTRVALSACDKWNEFN